jgi:hypothetical protein
MNNLSCLALGSILLLASCDKEPLKTNNDLGFEDPVLVLNATQYQSREVVPLEKPEDFDFYTKGVIEYTSNGETLALFSFGNGEKNTWGLKTMNNSSEEVDLTAKQKKSDYTKVIVKPLVKTQNCPYIVEGTIKYFKDKKWVATVDYGNGSCDDLATKTWDGGSKVFSLSGKK